MAKAKNGDHEVRYFDHPELGQITLLPLDDYDPVVRPVFLRPDDMVFVVGKIGWVRADQIFMPSKVCTAPSSLFPCVMRKVR